MKIGVPTEIKIAEKRVALTPTACKKLIKNGNKVSIQQGAGQGAGFADNLYAEAGCTIQPDAKTLYQFSELIVKVKEPLAADLENLTKDHLLFCYLHLAAEPELVENLKNIGLTAIAFETVVESGKTPLLAPMSAIAGRLSTQIGTWYLHAPRGGNGTLMGGISNIQAGNVTVVGAGVAGYEAAKLAYGMGANVTVLDINEARLAELKEEMANLNTEISTPETLMELAKTTDLMIGAVYVIGREAPNVITIDHVKAMPEGSVLVDISIDQGGCAETSLACTHESPVYEAYGVIHSAITNLPAAAPRTASQILSDAISPYVEKLASNNWSESLKQGVNVENGELKIEL